MKLKSLILGSVAAAGLSTAGFAADLGVLTSLDVCDELGLSGLTISSDTNCLQITGGVEYEFSWGDYGIIEYGEDGAGDDEEEDFGDDTDFTSGFPVIVTPIGVYTGDDETVNIGNGENDWESHLEAWLQFVGTASSDFGPAKAVIKLIANDQDTVFADEIQVDAPSDAVKLDEAYVSIGDTTVIMAGKKGSIAVRDDDAPFNYLGLFNSQAVDEGVWFADGDYLGGHVIQVVSDLGNGVSVAAGLENLWGDGSIIGTGKDDEGTAVGVISYAGSNVTAHVTAAAIGILDGDVDQYALHAGATGTFDMFKVRGAFGYNRINTGAGDIDIYNGLLSAEGTFDMFTIAASGEYAYSELTNLEGYGVGASVGAGITETISFNLGGRYFTSNLIDGEGDSVDTYQVAAQLVAAVTETLKVTGEVGLFGGEFVEAVDAFDNDVVYYGAAELAWAPGGGFTSSLRGEVNSEEAYKVTFKAAKSFE